jgi:hypothetical protein
MDLALETIDLWRFARPTVSAKMPNYGDGDEHGWGGGQGEGDGSLTGYGDGMGTGAGDGFRYGRKPGNGFGDGISGYENGDGEGFGEFWNDENGPA